MIHKIDVVLPLEESDRKTRWKEEVAKQLKRDKSEISEIRLLKRSIDARRKSAKSAPANENQPGTRSREKRDARARACGI